MLRSSVYMLHVNYLSLEYLCYGWSVFLHSCFVGFSTSKYIWLYIGGGFPQSRNGSADRRRSSDCHTDIHAPILILEYLCYAWSVFLHFCFVRFSTSKCIGIHIGGGFPRSRSGSADRRSSSDCHTILVLEYLHYGWSVFIHSCFVGFSSSKSMQPYIYWRFSASVELFWKSVELFQFVPFTLILPWQVWQRIPFFQSQDKFKC